MSFVYVDFILKCKCVSVMVELTSFKSLMVASVLIGYARSATVITQNLVVSEYIQSINRQDDLPAAVGLNMVFKGIFVFTVGQALGNKCG